MCNVCEAEKMLHEGLIAKGLDGKEYEFKAVGDAPEFSPVKWKMRPADQPWTEQWLDSDDLAGTASLLGLGNPSWDMGFQEWLFWQESLKNLGYIHNYTPLGKDFYPTNDDFELVKRLVVRAMQKLPTCNHKHGECQAKTIIDVFSHEFTDEEQRKFMVFKISHESPYNFRRFKSCQMLEKILTPDEFKLLEFIIRIYK